MARIRCGLASIWLVGGVGTSAIIREICPMPLPGSPPLDVQTYSSLAQVVQFSKVGRTWSEIFAPNSSM